MKPIRAGIVALVCSLAAAAFAVPRLLVAPLRSATDQKEIPVADQALANYLAQELADGGRVAPVVWGLADPGFRQAVLDGVLKGVPVAPTAEEAMDAARRLGARYTFLFSSTSLAGSVRAKGRLYDGGRLVWKDDKTMAVRSMGPSAENEANTLASIARTWAMLAARGPLRGIDAQLRMETPEAAPGIAPNWAPILPAAPPPSDALARARALADGGRPDSAILLLHDAVDAAPLDPSLRGALAAELLRSGRTREAAEVADRAASLMPERPELRTSAVRAWLAAGLPSQARRNLNEALARAPNAPETRLMAAEVALSELKPEEALSHLDVALQAAPSADGFALRAMARALLGGADGVALDLAEVAKLDPNPDPAVVSARYARIARLLDQATDRAEAEVDAIAREAVTSRSAPDLRDRIELARRQAAARGALADGAVPPPERAAAAARRALAQKLLAQALTELDRYVRTGADDALANCRIDLGEAIQQSAAAQKSEPKN